MRDEHRRLCRHGDTMRGNATGVHYHVFGRARWQSIDLSSDVNVVCAERAGNVRILRPHDEVSIIAKDDDDEDDPLPVGSESSRCDRGKSFPCHDYVVASG